MNKTIFKTLLITIAISFAGIACEGPTGPVGPQGADGQDGAMGLVGPASENGTNMHAGEGAPDESMGEPGDLYLDLTTGNLYGPKSQASDWGAPVNIIGKDGEDGKDGADGQDGTDGQDGADGKEGKDGKNGNDGKDGTDGKDGKDGADGSKIYAGDGAPSGGLGKNGDFYLDKTSFLLYGPKTSSGWGTSINLQGPIGPQGPQGPPGEDGQDGADGQDGNANVIYSEWLEIAWSLDDPTIKSMFIDENLITEELFNSGTILMYLKGGPEGNIVVLLPHIFENTFISFTIRHSVTPGLSVTALSLDGVTPVANSIADFEVRYVLIPGGVPLAKMPDDFIEDYEAVKEYYRIPD